MSIMSRLIARMYHLPPAETYDIAVERSLRIPMSDRVELGADRYYPRQSPDRPTILVRTPYGRRNYGMSMGYPLAERGFQVVIQSCRGTDDSGGEVSAFRGERQDGLATLEWLKAQHWFDGCVGMAGPSYMGFTQWALAAGGGPELKAISTHVTSSEFRSVMYPGGSFQLEIFLQWMQITESIRSAMLKYFRDMVSASRRLKAAMWHLPLSEADLIAVGRPVKFWQDWLTHTEPGDEWWASEDFSGEVAAVDAPNHLISGWYDFMLPQLLRDYASLQRAGRKPYLTIGPGSHSSSSLLAMGMQESIIWLRAHLLGEMDALRPSPVRIYVMGAKEWRDLPVWPPSNVQAQRWYLQPEAALSAELPPASPASQFQYDPADPTPSVGGATNATLGRGTGQQDNRKLEARRDVLTFTGKPLEQAVEIIGPVTAELYIKSSLKHTDFFVRLCDVNPDGRSLNVCDGIQRLFPGQPATAADGCRRVVVDLWPTAYRFKQGQRIRVQVSSGAFPRFARNLGTGEPLAIGTTMQVAEQHIFHDPLHPSAVILPVTDS